MKLFRTFRRTVQYRILVLADILRIGKHFDFRNLVQGLRKDPILLNVIHNLGRIVGTEDIIKKIR